MKDNDSMQTYGIKDSDGKLFAFEIENFWVSPRHLAKFLSSENGFTNVKVSTRKERLEEDRRLNFNFDGIEFVITEDYGDSSRYWVGPKDLELKNLSIEKVEAAFIKYRPSLLRKSVIFLLLALLIWGFLKSGY